MSRIKNVCIKNVTVPIWQAVVVIIGTAACSAAVSGVTAVGQVVVVIIGTAACSAADSGETTEYTE